MRPVRDGTRHKLAWQDLLLRRLTGEHGEVPVGGKTGRAEAEVDLGTNVYYFMGRVVPDFGAHVIGHDRHNVLAGVSTLSTPFDTGGLVHQKFTLNRDLNTVEIQEIIEGHSYSNLEYVPEMRTWLDESFASFDEYVVGSRPRFCLVEVISLSDCDERAWTWEGRLAARGYGNPPIKPIKIFMRRENYVFYITWLQDQAIFDEDEYFAHLDVLDDILDIRDDPALAMRDFLCEERLA